MVDNKLHIDQALAKKLIEEQFLEFRDLPICEVENSGWDNKTFHLGDEMLIRLPSAECYEKQVIKEQEWLPKLAVSLPLSIPNPIAMGKPSKSYPYKWSIYRWIEGEVASHEKIEDLNDFAKSLAEFLIALESINTTNGPEPGKHNFYRGGELNIYNDEVHRAIKILGNKIDSEAITEMWKAGLRSTWKKNPVWVHGDMSAGNLIIRDGKLSAVIDFGMIGIGDPACDLTIAWTFLRGESREIFFSMLPIDSETWARAKAWALWKALIILSGISTSNAIETKQCEFMMEELK